MLRIFVAAFLFVLTLGSGANAQSAFIVSSCGTLPAGIVYALGQIKILTQDTTGKLCDQGSGGVGGATAANQVLEIAQLTMINTVLGTTADAVCGTPTGTCTTEQLLKYANSQLALIVAGVTPLNGANNADCVTPVTTGLLPGGPTFPAVFNGSCWDRTPGAKSSGGTYVVNGGNIYNTVAASQTAQVMTGGSGGATGDYLSHCDIQPSSTSPGVFTILDNATTVFSFPGGATSTSNLVPFSIPIGALSVSGAWKITTGANISGTCYGKFH